MKKIPPLGEKQHLVMSRRKSGQKDVSQKPEEDAIPEGRCVLQHSVLHRDGWDNTGKEPSDLLAEGNGCHLECSSEQARQQPGMGLSNFFILVIEPNFVTRADGNKIIKYSFPPFKELSL